MSCIFEALFIKGYFGFVDNESHENVLYSIHPIQTCYRYSWAGVYDPEEDDGKLCDDFFPDDICFPPLVFTDGATGTGLPDIE